MVPQAGVELRRAARWALTGLLNTALHVATVCGLVEGLAVPPVPANGLAFIVANLFSYWLNSRYTFRAPATSRRYLRFLLVSVVGLGAALVASSLALWLHWHYLAGVALTMLVLPLLTYGAHRHWTWRPEP